MYKVDGMYGLKESKGYVIRFPSWFSVVLNTPSGVLNFLEDSSPVKDVVITDLMTNKEVTEEFVDENAV